MKKQLRIIALSSLAAMASVAAFVACSSDDTVVTNQDGGTEGGGNDSGNDSPITADTGSDAGLDVNVPDVTPFDGNTNDFVAQIETAMCGSITKCCFGSASVPDGGAVDGGHYNGGKCHDIVKSLGFEFSAVGSDDIDGGLGADGGIGVTIDGKHAQDCINALNGLTCNLSGTEMQTTRAACFSAFVGTRAIGQPCTAAMQCPTNALCHPDGGVCAPLVGDGGSCNVFGGTADSPDDNKNISDSIKDEEACSTRGSGDTKLRCNSYDPTNTSTGPDPVYFPRAQWTCQPQVIDGADCNSTVWCATGICDEIPVNGTAPFKCKSPYEYWANTCPGVLNP